ncbi:MAG: DUF5681 domain-containing protein [Candidatus Gastranaerophilales bacterium]|nr:DUF5681 domain-containing protein [Candidatus Gastranaerophilales bacterium]
MVNEYEIGYGKPPQEHSFKPGFSGNKKGRPKGSKNTYNLLNEILNQKIIVKENDENIKISKKIAMLTQLVNKGVKGDIKAITTLLPHMLMSDLKEEDREKVLASLNQDDRAIIQMYLSNFDGVKEANDSESN